ncbi:MULTISPECIES: RodZ domain-containing protein [unclassified Avibacterium]|uniref:RodZ domain-containing protein n=1 Tax=unclassified Avibacterium TaxID=2685287 RepID=UPI002026F487|nr:MULTISPECIES: RodZ family helix-turn-helix domain-containing protein [unclassified Avibacterium]MCW9698582.1 helix-turn-helix domain-containing protein [Avibacterium sp. 20-129]MCW9732393.1 helix-turn-helix domain-containing protein [Avibacterium sp. 20-15]URL04559.1 helix-turn-helix domain-containing protein [Avibacterium sp. 20-132]URL07185.1 helix-turn-helix domain-containing protein [Avibacterium sp. 21-595]
MATSNENQETIQQSLGEHFRQAREALNLSLDDVSKQLNLRPSILQRLENNEFTHSSISATYIKGYIRNYAKYLRLPESLWSSVVNSLEETTKNDLTRGVRATQAVNEYSSHNRWIGWVSAVVVIALLAVTALWWWENYQKSNAERDDLVQNYVETQQENSTQNSATSQENVIALTPKAIDAEKTAQNSTALSQPVTVEQIAPVEENNTNAKASVENAQPQVAAVQSVSAENTYRQVQSETSAQLLQSEMNKINAGENRSTMESAVENPAVSIPTSDAVLRIEITGASCWVRVRDANRKVLAEKLYKQGEVLNFDQNTAYDLTIGAPSNVKITYKGAVYPLKVDGRVAKFKLQ